MSKTLARENAFRTIYSKIYDKSFDGLDASDDLTGKFNNNFYTQIIENFENNFEELNSIVVSNLKGITIDRVYNIDLALIYLALTEIKYIGTEKKIVLNEVIELSKKYSTDKSFKFINGFLAGIVK